MSIFIEGGGIQGMAMQAFLSAVLTVTNAENKQIQNPLKVCRLCPAASRS